MGLCLEPFVIPQVKVQNSLVLWKVIQEVLYALFSYQVASEINLAHESISFQCACNFCSCQVS
jgi:hypothetical protein